MSDDIAQKLRVTMPDFKGIEISCPCRIRSLLMREAADEIEKLIRERDEARAEVERLRTGLHHISLCSQNSMSSKGECGRIARETLEAKP